MELNQPQMHTVLHPPELNVAAIVLQRKVGAVRVISILCRLLRLIRVLDLVRKQALLKLQAVNSGTLMLKLTNASHIITIIWTAAWGVPVGMPLWSSDTCKADLHLLQPSETLPEHCPGALGTQ